MSMILLVDDHGVYRSGLRQLIEMNIEQSRVAEACSIEHVRAGECFDLILIDAGGLSQRSLSVLKQVHEANPASRLAVLSTSNIRADVLNCLSVGFHGFVHKLQLDNELITAVNELLSGRIYVPRWFAEGDDDKSEVSPSVNARMNRLRLTRRQREILPLLAQGMSNKEIARHLHIAEGTTKIHTAALVRALGARNRTEAAFLAATQPGSNEPFRFGECPAPGLPTYVETSSGRQQRMNNGCGVSIKFPDEGCGRIDAPVLDRRSNGSDARSAKLGAQKRLDLTENAIEHSSGATTRVTITLDKSQKTAAELAELIRTSLGKSDIRVAVFPATRGSKARLYPEPGNNDARLKGLVEENAAILGEQYELIH